MKYNVIVSQKAATDIKKIERDIREEFCDERSAEAIRELLYKTIASLDEFPYRHAVYKKVQGIPIRGFPIRKYLIAYLIVENINEVVVTSVLRPKQNIYTEYIEV